MKATEKEIIRLKKRYLEAKARIKDCCDTIEQFKRVIELILWLQDIIKEHDRLKKQMENINNKSMRYKVKMRRRPVKFAKEMDYFEAKVRQEMKNNCIPNSIGKKMLAMIKLIRSDKPEYFDSMLDYFNGLLRLNNEYENAVKELERQVEACKKELRRLNIVIKEKRALNKINIDMNKIKVYKEYLSELDILERLRIEYIEPLISLPINELISLVKKDSLFEFGFPKIDEHELGKLKEFFSEYKFFADKKVSDIVDMFSYSDAKLSHLYPEISSFKKKILVNRLWFERVSRLDKSDFLRFDLNDKQGFNQKLISFYKKNVPNASSIIDKIKIPYKTINEYKKIYEEYERYKREEERLKGYSEEEINDKIYHLTQLIKTLEFKDNDDDRKNNIVIEERDESTKENDKEKAKKGILHRLRSFFGG
ncbi:hypothetical protein J7J26_01890 [Candidatus Micrarchaeota archaeon]|nr:hypothetical protein [Candidatus Micrarchaeota archaeon]